MKLITVDEWRHVPAGVEVQSGYSYTLRAPREPEGTYTLYQLVDEKNTHRGWEWERDVVPAGEDKLKITRRLFHLLELTRAGSDIVKLDYFTEKDGDFTEEKVLIVWKSGTAREVNVTADSGIALIKDVIFGLGG